MAYPKKLSVVLECFVKETRFQKFVNSALEYYQASCAVRVIGMIADWTCFGSKNIEVARNAGLGVSTGCSLVSRSITMTFCGLFSQDTGEAYLKNCLVLEPKYFTVSLHCIRIQSKCFSATYRGEGS